MKVNFMAFQRLLPARDHRQVDGKCHSFLLFHLITCPVTCEIEGNLQAGNTEVTINIGRNILRNKQTQFLRITLRLTSRVKMFVHSRQ